MYAVVVGGGKMGFHLARESIEQEHEVTIIERDLQRALGNNEQLGEVSVIGDGCEPRVQKEAGAGRADVFIALTGKDEDNLVACQVARHVFNVPKTIAMVNNPRNEQLFNILGVDVVVSSTGIILQHIEEELPAPTVVHMQGLGVANRQLLAVRVPGDASAVGKSIKELGLPPDAKACLIIEAGGETYLPTQDVVLRGGDQVLLVTTPENETLVHEKVTGVE